MMTIENLFAKLDDEDRRTLRDVLDRIDQSKDRSFMPGDVCKLKSGGPLMTIRTSDGGSVCAMWFADGEFRSGDFAIATLERIDLA